MKSLKNYMAFCFGFLIFTGIVLAESNSPDDDLDKDKKEVAVRELLRLKTDIEKRFPKLESERNRLFKLTNELKEDLRIGCRANQPLKNLKIEVDGNEIATRLLKSDQKNKSMPPQSTGKCTELEFTLGSGISFTIDQDTRSIFKSAYESEDLSQKAVVGGIGYLQIAKKGICLDNLRQCHMWFLGSESCTYDVYEHHMYTITGLRIYANDVLAYSRSGLNLIFDSSHALSWSDNTLVSNEAWIKLMQREDCNQIE